MKIATKLLGMILCFSPLGLQGSSFVIQDLGTLVNQESIPCSINNNNMVTGKILDQDKTVDFFWEKNKGLTCLTLSTSFQTPLVNNSNTIVGTFWEKPDYWFSVSRIQYKNIYFRYSDGSFQSLEAPPKWEIEPLDDWDIKYAWRDKKLGIVGFNDKGQVLVSNYSDPEKATEFAVWQNEEYEYIDPQALNMAYAINNKGLILGRKWVKEDSVEIPILVLYDFKQNITIEIMKDVNLTNKTLNDQGQVVIIQSKKKDLGDSRGFLWDQNSGLLPLNDFLPVVANNHNQMAGFKVMDGNLVPFFWDNGEMLNLNEDLKIDDFNSLWDKIVKFCGINDRGHIIGQGVFEGKKHAFILSPKLDFVHFKGSPDAIF